MIVKISHKCDDFNSFRANKVKSLFNASNAYEWSHIADLPIDGDDWQIGLIVGPSGSGKSSIGKEVFNGEIYDIYSGWDNSKPIVDCIAPNGDFKEVTGALSAVGLGDVPAWLRPFHVLSNGEQFRAGLARLICERPSQTVVDEFTSVIDRQIAKVGASAFAKTWRRGTGKIILLSCHYDIIEWLRPDWIYDTAEARFARDCLRQRPQLELQIYKVSGSVFKHFKPHYYLDLPLPVAAEYFVGIIDGEPVCHLAVCPLFTAKAYRATRLVVMPEWQGAGVGTRFLDAVCEYHLQGNGRCGYKYPTFFHTSHPQLCGALRRSKKWVQTGASLYGSNKRRSAESIKRSREKNNKIFSDGSHGAATGYGGHFRAVQAFKYLG
jgi:ABC-type ATPase involved in cell division